MDKFIRNELSVDELSNFLISNVYNGFPDFIKMIGGEDRARKLLKENIVEIVRIPIDNEFVKATYGIGDKKITIYSTHKVTINEILNEENDEKSNEASLLHKITHESIHAILNVAIRGDVLKTSCFVKCSLLRPIIRKSFRDMSGISSNNNFITRLIEEEKFFKEILDDEVGEALAEGCAEWIVEKMLGEKRKKGFYECQLDYFKIIEHVKGLETAIKIATGDYECLESILNMNYEKTCTLLKRMDLVAGFCNRYPTLCKCENYWDEIGKYNVCNLILQKNLVRNLILPEMKELANSGEVDNKSLFNMYYAIVKMHKLNKNFVEEYNFNNLYEDPLFVEMREKFKELYVINAKNFVVAEATNKEILSHFEMYNDLVNGNCRDVIKALPISFRNYMTQPCNRRKIRTDFIFGGDNIQQRYSINVGAPNSSKTVDYKYEYER